MLFNGLKKGGIVLLNDFPLNAPLHLLHLSHDAMRNRAETFETMAEISESNSVDEESVSVSANGDSETQRRFFFSSEKDASALVGTNMTNETTLQSVFNDSKSCSMEINDKPSAQAVNSRLKARNGAERNTATPGHELNSEELSEDKENNGFPHATITAGR